MNSIIRFIIFILLLIIIGHIYPKYMSSYPTMETKFLNLTSISIIIILFVLDSFDAYRIIKQYNKKYIIPVIFSLLYLMIYIITTSTSYSL